MFVCTSFCIDRFSSLIHNTNCYFCSADDSYLHDSFDNGWETGATEQGRASNDDEENVRIQSSSHYINYQSYMDKTPTSRWSKSDTELFYEV